MKILKDNGLSLVLTALFLLSLVGQAASGFHAENQERKDHGEPPLSITGFLTSGEFIETVFENWESEFLQMAAYVILTAMLIQRGSAESKDPDSKEDVDEDPRDHAHEPGVPIPVKRGGFVLKLYENSLSIAFGLLFVLSFVGHAYGGAKDFNEQAAQHGSPERLSLFGYMKEPRFWFESFQNWQSEFLAVLCVVVFTIWLRQRASPESKPVHAKHADTGR